MNSVSKWVKRAGQQNLVTANLGALQLHLSGTLISSFFHLHYADSFFQKVIFLCEASLVLTFGRDIFAHVRRRFSA